MASAHTKALACHLPGPCEGRVERMSAKTPKSMWTSIIPTEAAQQQAFSYEKAFQIIDLNSINVITQNLERDT
jgi:hypothetical protein